MTKPSAKERMVNTSNASANANRMQSCSHGKDKYNKGEISMRNSNVLAAYTVRALGSSIRYSFQYVIRLAMQM